MADNSGSEKLVDSEQHRDFTDEDEAKTQIETEKTSFPWLLYLSSFTANLLLINAGLNCVWLSPILPRLMSNDTTINPLERPIEVTEISLLGTVAIVMVSLTLLPSAKLSDTIGRKKVLLLIAIVSISNYVAVSFARHVWSFFAFATILGACTSAILVCVPVYNNEIAEDKNRGSLGCFMGMGQPTGVLFGYILGLVFGIKKFFFVSTVPCILHLVLAMFTVESPMYFALKGRRFEGIRCLDALRTYKDRKQIYIEYSKIELFIENNIKQQNKSILGVFRNRSCRKAFLISVLVCATQQFSGIFILLGFMATIFSNEGFVSGDTFGIIAGIVQLLVCFMSSFIVEKLGKRKLLLISSITCSVALVSLGFYFCLKSVNLSYTSHLIWLPIVFIIVFLVGYGIGLGPVPITLAAELFPTDLRATGCASVMLIEGSVMCFTMFSFPLVTHYYGVQYSLWFFGAACFTGFLLIYRFVPDYKGKSLLQIQEMLS